MDMEMEVVEEGEESVSGGEEMDEGGVNRDPFENISLPEVFPGVSRDVSWNAVIQTGEPSLESLRNALTQGVGGSLGRRDNEKGSPNISEIFAINWPSSLRRAVGRGPKLLRVSDLLFGCQGKKKADRRRVRLGELLMSNKQSYRKGQRFALVELDVEGSILLDQLENLCKVVRPITVHWFRAFQFGFMWRVTISGGSSSMFSIPSKCTSIKYGEDTWLRNLNEDRETAKLSGCIFPKNVICISGLAGSGKSVLLAKVAHELKKSFEDRLIFFVDLSLLSFRMLRMDEEMDNGLNFDLFFQLICEYFGIDKDSEKTVLEGILSPNSLDQGKGSGLAFPKLELLMDGLDEMDSRMRVILLTFLQVGGRPSPNSRSFSDRWSFRVWITTRPHLKPEVEQRFNLVAFDLENLGRIDILAYLQSCKDDADAGDDDDGVELISSRFQDHLKLDLTSLLSIPARMIGFQWYLHERESLHLARRPFKLYNLNGWDVVGAVMDDVKERYMEKKCKNGIRIVKEDLRAMAYLHAVLAHQTLLGIIEEAGTGSPLGWEMEGELLQQEVGNLLDFGIVKQGVAGKLSFVHDAFVSYMLALYYTSYVPEDNGDAWIGLFFLCVLYRDECEGVRQLYNQRLATGVDIQVSGVWEYLVVTFLIRLYDLSRDDDDNPAASTDHGNLLQLMIIDQKLRIAKLILRSFLCDRLAELKRLIGRRVRVEVNGLRKGSQKNFIELSALSFAVMFGDRELLDMMYWCLERDGVEYDPEEGLSNLDQCRFTPLHLAVMGGNLETLDYLKNVRGMKGENTMDLFGHLPLHLVFYNGWDLKFSVREPYTGYYTSSSSSSPPQPRDIFRHIKIRKYYNDTDDDIEGVSSDRISQFPILASKMDPGQLEHLKMKKNLPSFSHKPINNPAEMVYYNSIRSYLSIVEKLTEATSINFEDSVGGVSSLVEPPFHLACAEGFLPIVKCMVEMNVKIGIRGRDRSTALLSAILKGHVHIVNYLLSLQGMDKSDLGKVFKTVPLLHHICSKNLWKMGKLFVLEMGQSVDLKGKGGRTPLHYICSDGLGDKRLATVKMLLEMGASVNAQDRNKVTPLMYACQVPRADDNAPKPNFNLIMELIRRGAEVNAQNETGESALHYAVSSGNANLVRHLISTCKQISEGQTIDLGIKTTKMVEGIGGGGMRAGSTPLHFACRKRGNLGIIKCLIEEGAEVNPLDSLQQSPLHILASCVVNGETELEETLEFLVKHGAWLMFRSNLNQKPFVIIHRQNPELAVRLLNDGKMYIDCFNRKK